MERGRVLNGVCAHCLRFAELLQKSIRSARIVEILKQSARYVVLYCAVVFRCTYYNRLFSKSKKKAPESWKIKQTPVLRGLRTCNHSPKTFRWGYFITKAGLDCDCPTTHKIPTRPPEKLISSQTTHSLGKPASLSKFLTHPIPHPFLTFGLFNLNLSKLRKLSPYTSLPILKFPLQINIPTYSHICNTLSTFLLHIPPSIIYPLSTSPSQIILFVNHGLCITNPPLHKLSSLPPIHLTPIPLSDYPFSLSTRSHW